MKVLICFSLFLITQSLLVVCSSGSSAQGDKTESDISASAMDLQTRPKRKVLHPKMSFPAGKIHNLTTQATTNLSTNPIVSPLNDTIWLKANELERQATNAMLCMSGLLILLFGCVFWSGMLKHKNSYIYPAQDGSWQSAERKDKLFNFNIKELIQSKLRSLRLPKVQRKRKRKSKGPSYLELKQKDIEMSSTSEEDFYGVT